jgi:DNA helicase IV
VHHPESARGLEFDAVIVVEPGTFPKNVGRDGQLYTSLTRANRELAVVLHASLPDGLRKAARG